jgi:hypothetical protein
LDDLSSPAAAAHVEQLYIQPMLAEDPRLIGDQDRNLRAPDGAVDDPDLFEGRLGSP